MPAAERSVLHVLPHPGGGGETYVDLVSRMEGYRFERAHLASSPDPRGARRSIALRAAQIQRAARSFDLVHVVGEVASTLCLPILALKPSIMSPQGLHLLRRLDGIAREVSELNLRLLVRAATRTICSSRSEHAELIEAVSRRAAARAIVISNGVGPVAPVTAEQKAALRVELGLSPTGTVGAWVAALDEHKDPLSPIHAANRVRREDADVTLLVAGDGPLRAELERAASETDAVRLLGFRSDVQRILGASDFFVLSSRREGLSFSLLEAMAHGLAPVVSDSPANVEAVADAGVVVPYGDVGRFADTFARLAKEPHQRQELGDRARERAERHFSLDEMLQRTRELYDEILEGPSSRR